MLIGLGCRDVEFEAFRLPGWLINPHARIDTLEEQVQLFNEFRNTAGLPAGEVPLIREACLGETDAEAYAVAREFLEPKYQAYVAWGQDKALPSHDPLDREFEALAEERFVIGATDTCKKMLMECSARLGTDLVLLRVQWPGMAHGRAMETIFRLGEAVMPSLRAA